MAAKKTYHPDPYRFKRQFSYKHTEKVFERRKTERKKKKDFTDLESSPRVSRQNKFNLASFSAYPLELTKQQREIIVL